MLAGLRCARGSVRRSRPSSGSSSAQSPAARRRSPPIASRRSGRSWARRSRGSRPRARASSPRCCGPLGGLVRGARESFGWIAFAANAVGVAFRELKTAWLELTGTGNEAGDAMLARGADFEGLGHIIGLVLGGAVTLRDGLFGGSSAPIHLVLRGGEMSAKLVFGGVADFITAWAGDRMVLRRGAAKCAGSCEGCHRERA